MSATQIIDFLQANAVLITFDPAVEYPAGYIVEYDQKLYIANDVIPADTGFVEGSTGATFSVLNPTNGLTDAELRASPVDVTSSIYIREDRWICLNDGPAPVEYLEGHQLRRMEFFDTVSGTNSFVWFNLSTNTSLTESPLPADVIFNGPATEIKQDVGNQVLNDVKTRLPTSVGLKTEDLSLSVTLSNANSVMQITQYNVITSGTGYTVGNVLRRTTFFNNATGATTTKWYNVSTTAVLAAAPNLAHLSARTDKIGAIGQLPAVLGKLTDAESLSVVQTNAISASVVDTKKYDVITAGTGYAVNDILRRIETFDANSKTTTVTWYNTTTGADIAAPILADLSLRVEATTQQQKFALTNSITFFDVITDATEYLIGDILRRLSIFDPNTGTTDNYWYNVTQQTDISAPIGGDIVEQVNLNDNSVVHQTYTYVATIAATDYAVNDVIFRVESLDPTNGLLTSVWRNVTQGMVIPEPVMADITLSGVSSPLVYSQLPSTLGKKAESSSLSVVVANKNLEVYEQTKYTATGNAANGTDYLVGNSLLAIDYIDKATSIITRTWRNTTLNTVLGVAPNPLHLSAGTSIAGPLSTQFPTSLGKKAESASLSVVVANPDNTEVYQTVSYTVTTDAVNGTDYLVGNAITKYVYLNKSTSTLTTVWRNITLDTTLATPPNVAHLSTGTVTATLQYNQLPSSLGLQDAADSLSVVVANPDSTILNNTYRYTATADAGNGTDYLTGDIIEAYEIFDKVTLVTTVQWKNITQDAILTTPPVPADLSAPTVDSPLVYSQLPASLGLQDAADSLSVVVANQDNKVLRGTMTYTVVTAATGYAVGDMLQQFFLLNKETFETEIVWRNATQNTILATAPVLANLSTGTLSADVQYNQLPDSLGKKAAASSLSVVLATDPSKQLQAVYTYTATVANGVHYSVNDFIRRMDYTDFSTGEVLTVWRNVTQNKIITTINFPDFSPIGDTRGLLYTQLPTSLGKKTDANSLSVVVSNATTKVLDSSTTYTATADAGNGTDYLTNDKIGKYVYLDLADSSTSTVWRNLTTSTTIPTPNDADLGSAVVADPLQYSQLPTALGPQDDADSLSVVVSNPDGKVWLGCDYYEATTNDNDYSLGDLLTKYNYLDIKNSKVVFVWKNDTTDTVIPAPNMLNVGLLSGKNPLDASQLPQSLGLKATANSLSVAVANQRPSFVNASQYVAIADDTVNSLYVTDDVINKYTFVSPEDGIQTVKWYNVTQDAVIDPPNPADVTGGASSNPLAYEQLPASLGLKTAANSLSVVVADAKDHVLHSSRTYSATAASATPGKYDIGDIVRVVDTFDMITKTPVVVIYNISTATEIDEFNIADFTRLTPDHLLYNQLPTALGLQDAADSLSVVVADQQNKVVLSVERYKALTASVTPGEYAINDELRRIEFQDVSDNTISYVWRNLTSNTPVTTVNLANTTRLTGDPLQYTQLPALLGLQAADDSLSVVVADQLSDLFIEKKSFTATADQTGVTIGDIVRRYQLYNPVTATTTYKWYNVTQEADIEVPGDTSLFDPYTGDSTAVSNKILYRAEHYKAVTDQTEWVTDDILVKNIFLDLMDNSFTHSWRNLTTNITIDDTAEPAPADVQELGLNTQLPVTLGRKAREQSLSVVQSNPVGQSMSYFKAITANGAHYSVGDILRRWEIVDVYADEIIVRWTNKTQMKQITAANVNAAHITEITATEVAFKSVERTPGFYSVTTDGTLAAGTVAASFFNIGTIDATVAGGTLSPGFAVNFEAPKGDTLAAIVYTCDADSTLLINTLT